MRAWHRSPRSWRTCICRNRLSKETAMRHSGYPALREYFGLIMLVSLASALVSFPVFMVNPTVAQPSVPTESTWVTDGTVYSIDSAGDSTYIGGNFSQVGPSTGCGVPIDTTTGQVLPVYPKVNRVIYAVAADGEGGFYIGGDFTRVGGLPRNRIAHILDDGTVDLSWNPGMNGDVFTLAVSGSTVYAGGDFTSVDGTMRNYIAAFDKESGSLTSWDPWADGPVQTLAVLGSTVYAGGKFTRMGGVVRNRIAAIDAETAIATSWDPNSNYWIWSIKVEGSTVYAGGAFTHVGGSDRNFIAALDTATGLATPWNPDANEWVQVVTISGSTVYAGGGFTGIGGQARNRLAAIDANTGAALPWNPDANRWVDAIVVSGGYVYVAGNFTTLNGAPKYYLAAVDPTTGVATSWDPRPNYLVHGIDVSGSTIFAGGHFTSVGGVERHNIAAIGADGTATEWNPDVDGVVYVIKATDLIVYAGGGFITIGGETRNHVAAIDPVTGKPTSWDPDADDDVHALAVLDATVYAGGCFINIGAEERNHIAAIDAEGAVTSWNPSADHFVYALETHGSNVLVGGGFTNIGGCARNRIAEIESDGTATSWNPDAGNTVRALAVSGSTVYAGGYFHSMGSEERNCIAAIDADTGDINPWDPDANERVYALAVSGSTVYAGGFFSTIGGSARNYVAAIDKHGNAACWNPDAASVGVGEVYALGLSGSGVNVGGHFTEIGGESRSYFARFRYPSPSINSVSPGTGKTGESVKITALEGMYFREGAVVRLKKSEQVDMVARNTSVVSSSNITCEFTIPSDSEAGLWDVEVINDDTQSCTLEDGFSIEYPAPTITSITPASAQNPGMVQITSLEGTGFRTGATVKLQKSGQSDIAATNVRVASSTRITCTFDLNGVADGPWNLHVANPDGRSATKMNAFTVAEAPSASSTWYLAEGTTAWGYHCYITIENPNSEPVTADITYNTDNGAEDGGTVNLPAMSQTTVDPADTLGEKDFSTRVECNEGKVIAVDRTMFWTGQGAPSQEGHSSIGTTTPSKTWYLPEGSSNWGFETWTLIQNPGATDAKVKLTYMTEGGTPQVFDRTVSAHCRATYIMAADIGAADASLKVTSDVPVVAERSMYRNNRREGSCSIGATAPATDYFLAEGATGYDVGFTTYVLVQNPNDSDAQVTLTYQTQSGPKPQAPFTMSANSRRTVRVNDQLPANTNVSTQVHGSKPIIAERAMYWGAGTPLGEAMHASIGLDSPHVTFYLPDGQTSDGHEAWTLIQNPNPGSVTVRITYLLQGGGTPVSFTDEIGANTRSTYAMADKLAGGRASIMVESLDGARPVMVERSMYWNYRGAGTDTIGGYSD